MRLLPQQSWLKKKKVIPYIFVAPAIVLLFCFMVYPIGFAAKMSFQKWDILSTPKYIGFKNYIDILSSSDFWNSIILTFIFVFVTLPVNITLALLVAMFLNRKGLFGRNIVRSLVFFPAITSVVAVGLIWKYMYSPEYGVINYFLSLLNKAPSPWLSDPNTALPSLMFILVWAGFGWNMVILLAALQDVPDVYYEAALIDGAGKWQLFRYITLPLIKPTILVVSVMTTIATFRGFDLIYISTQGGPGNATMLLMMYFYREAFVMFRMGKATAIGFIIFFIVLILTIIQLRLGKTEEYY